MANDRQRDRARQAAVNRREFAAALGDLDCPVELGMPWEAFYARCLARLEAAAKKRAGRRSTRPQGPRCVGATTRRRVPSSTYPP